MLLKFIKQLRKKRNLTQEFLASELGISRPTYLQIEKGARGLTLSEAQKLADIYGLTLEALLNQTDFEAIVERHQSIPKREIKPEVRISIPQNNLEKFEEVLLYILAKVGSRPNIGETAIYKLLYFIDFDYYEKYEEQLIGAKYIRNSFGPTPVHFKKLIEEMVKKGEIEAVESKFFEYPQRKYLPRRQADLSKISGQEIAHIDEVLNRLASKTAKELTEYSHADTPWRVKKSGEVLDYESVFYRDQLHSVRDNGNDTL